jgi:hypothetical protein
MENGRWKRMRRQKLRGEDPGSFRFLVSRGRARPLELRRSGVVLGAPIAQAYELFYFPAFIAVFVGFSGTIVNVTEGMLRIANGFGYEVDTFCHNFFPFVRVFQKRNRADFLN